MAQRNTRTPGTGAWQWSRTAETRRVILQAAREVFTERGFTEAGIAAVVERSGSSVGSLYHHFGGKTELFLALWDEFQAEQERRAASAVAELRAAGEKDPMELLVAGARAFLAGAWDGRDLMRLFMDGDGPPGFGLMRRTRARAWVRQNAVLLGAGASAVERATITILTTIIGEAGREVSTCETAKEADQVAETTIRLIRRLDPMHIGGPATAAD
ncbi:MAG: helix-turn-helix domain containing protein [Nocardiopsaceae bacterium]|nr:helix-turn-helix domain containing protein [Nocardiopsaceae bacterium]